MPTFLICTIALALWLLSLWLYDEVEAEVVYIVTGKWEEP